MATDPTNAKVEDSELIARILAGDKGAAETLVRQHTCAMLAVARRFLGCEAESADAVQEAFILAFRALGSFAGSSALATWLHRIVVNRSLWRLQWRKRQPTVSLDSLQPALEEHGCDGRRVRPPVSVPEDELSRAELCAQVRACINRLPEVYRKVIVLRDLEELDTDQTAARLGTTVGVVKTRLHRARQALRSLLEPVVRRWEWCADTAEAEPRRFRAASKTSGKPCGFLTWEGESDEANNRSSVGGSALGGRGLRGSGAGAPAHQGARAGRH